MQSPPESALTEEDRRALLEYARQCVRAAVEDAPKPLVPAKEVFSQTRGVFVTLHVNGRLRGCIGVIEPDGALEVTAAHCAAGAALHDPRFPHIRTDDLGSLQIEISLLSTPALIRPEEIEIGRHGLIVCKDRHKGLLLPQVATEHSLDREAFLAETCRKAGLPRDAWKTDDIQIFGFTCDVFSDVLH